MVVSNLLKLQSKFTSSGALSGYFILLGIVISLALSNSQYDSQNYQQLLEFLIIFVPSCIKA